MKKIIENKWWLIFGLLIVPISFILLMIIVGTIIGLLKSSDLSLNLLMYWKHSFNNYHVILLSGLVSLICYFYYAYKICFNKKKQAGLKATNKDDYGNARWLSNREINNLYPLVNTETNHDYHGFIVNSKIVKKTLFHNLRTNTHTLVIGGTGSGKTQGLVLPTININSKSKIKPSMIITDVKSELYQSQAKLLQEQNYNVRVLNLRDIKTTITWNPLQSIYDQFKEMLVTVSQQEKLHLKVSIQSDIKDLVKSLFTNTNKTDPFWNDSGILITEAIILGILEQTEALIENHQTKDNKLINMLLETYLSINRFNLASVAVIASLEKDMIKWFKSFPPTSVARITANQVLSNGSKTLTSILITMSTYLAIFKNDFIRNLTCQNDLDFNQFISKPTALFIVVPDENHNYYVLVTLLINQLYKFLVRAANKDQTGKLIRPVYFLCDEFANLPPFPNIEMMITIARSRNIFFQLIIQDLQQLKEKYGAEIANIIFTNCSLHIFLQTMDLETAEKYSKMIGDSTVVQVSISKNDKANSYSENLKNHVLISASQLIKLAVNQAIVLYAKENPFKANLIPWYQINKNSESLFIISKKVKLINFEKDYYFDVKKNT